MINDHNDDRPFGGPNADASERIKKMLEKPGIPQERSAVDLMANWREEFEKSHPRHQPEFDPLNCVWCHRIQMISMQGLSVREHVDFPPKHVYEPVEVAKPVSDYVGCPTAVIHFGEKKKFL